MHFSGFVPVFRQSHAHSLGATVTRRGGSDDNFTSCFKNQNANSDLQHIRTTEQKSSTQLKECMGAGGWQDVICCGGGICSETATLQISQVNQWIVVTKLWNCRRQEEWLLHTVITKIYKKHSDSIVMLRFSPQTWVTLTYLLSPT